MTCDQILQWMRPSESKMTKIISKIDVTVKDGELHIQPSKTSMESIPDNLFQVQPTTISNCLDIMFMKEEKKR